MKDFLAKQALKIMCSLILIPVTRFVLMPALIGQMPPLSEGTSLGNDPSPFRSFGGTQITEVTEITVSSPMSAEAQKKMQEAVRHMSFDPANSTIRMKTAPETSTSVNKPASQPPSKTDTANRQSRVIEVQGHKIQINPAKTSASSVVIQPGSKGQPAKCPPRKT